MTVKRALLLALAIVGCSKKPAPVIEQPVLAISLALEGADAATIERDVVVHVEQAANRITGVRAIESRIGEGHATITLDVAAGDLDRVAHELQHAFGPELPPELAPPVITRRRKHDDPVMWISVRGTLPIGPLSEHARQVASRLERQPGVGRVELRGLARPAVIVRPDFEQLAARNVTLAELVSAVAQTGGRLRDDVQPSDVATVEHGFERDASSDPAIAIHAQYGVKSSVVIAAVRDEIAKLPPGVQFVEVAPPPSKPPAPLVVTMQGPDLDQLERSAGALVSDLAVAGISDVLRDPPLGEHAVTLVPDRERIAQLGIAMTDVATTLRALRGTPISARGGQDVVVRVADSIEKAIARANVRSREGALVPVANIVTVSYDTRRTILRRDRERVVALSIYAPQDKLALARKIAGERELGQSYRTILTP